MGVTGDKSLGSFPTDIGGTNNELMIVSGTKECFRKCRVVILIEVKVKVMADFGTRPERSGVEGRNQSMLQVKRPSTWYVPQHPLHCPLSLWSLFLILLV